MDDHGDQEYIEQDYGTDDSGHGTLRRLRNDACQRGDDHVRCREQHESLVGIWTIPLHYAQRREHRKQTDADEWEDQEDIRIGERVGGGSSVNAPLAVDRYEDACKDHSRADQDAPDSEQLMNIAPAVRDQTRLRDQQQYPRGRQCTM